jgi:hypothetical protein
VNDDGTVGGWWFLGGRRGCRSKTHTGLEEMILLKKNNLDVLGEVGGRVGCSDTSLSLRHAHTSQARRGRGAKTTKPPRAFQSPDFQSC